MLLHQGAQIILGGDLRAVHADDAVTGLQTGLIGRAALGHVHDVDAIGVHAQLLCRLCVGHSQVGDAQIGAAGHIAVLQQLPVPP